MPAGPLRGPTGAMVTTQSVVERIPTQSVGTRLSSAPTQGLTFLPGVLATVPILTISWRMPAMTGDKRRRDIVIRRRYAAGLVNFFHHYRHLAATWQVIDNSQKGRSRLVAAGTRQITRVSRDDSIWARIREQSSDV